MLLYVSVYLFTLFVFFFSIDRNAKILNNKILAFLFTGILIIIAGCRYNISTDYWHYYKFFMTYNGKTRVELGFKWLLVLTQKFCNKNYNAFVFVIAVISLTIKGCYFSKLQNPFLGLYVYLALYFFDSDFNVIRQGLGIGFVWYAIDFGKKKKIIPYILFILLATSFHTVYLILIPGYFICSKEIELDLRKFIFFTIIIFIIRVTCVPFVLMTIRSILINSNNLIVMQICKYLGVDKFHINFSILRRLAILIFYLLIVKPKKVNVYFIMYFMSFAVSLLLSGNEMFAHRLSMCFDIFSVPLFASETIVWSKKNIVYVLGLVACLTVLYFGGTMKAALPYQTYILSNMNE